MDSYDRFQEDQNRQKCTLAKTEFCGHCGSIDKPPQAEFPTMANKIGWCKEHDMFVEQNVHPVEYGCYEFGW